MTHAIEDDPAAPVTGTLYALWMVHNIFISAAGLFAAVSVAYLISWYNSGDLTRAQTLAFVTWLLGHVFLAFNLHSERQPLLRLGLFSNRLMIVWSLAMIASSCSPCWCQGRR